MISRPRGIGCLDGPALVRAGRGMPPVSAGRLPVFRAGWPVLFLIAAIGCQPAGDDAPAAASATQAIASVFDGTGGTWVDLSYGYSDETVYWPTAEAWVMDTVAYGMTEAGYFYSAYTFATAEHGGTHLDAPIHFAEGGMAADEIPLGQLIGPAVVIDVQDQVGPDTQVGVEVFTAWEAEHGRIPDGAILLVRTGWGDRWPDAAAYLGTDGRGAEAVPNLHFPGIAPEATRWLVEERDVDAVGIDTASIDYGQSSTYETHVILYGADKPGFENVANLGVLPETGAYVVALPMKIVGGSGGPLRLVAFIPNGVSE